MALTPEILNSFRGPSIWRESDCVYWLHAITALSYQSSVWHEEPTELAALRRARVLYGSYALAVTAELQGHGYRQIRPRDGVRTLDVIMVEDSHWGTLPAGVLDTGDWVIRHPYGIAVPWGRFISLWRRL